MCEREREIECVWLHSVNSVVGECTNAPERVRLCTVRVKVGTHLTILGVLKTFIHLIIRQFNTFVVLDCRYKLRLHD